LTSGRVSYPAVAAIQRFAETYPEHDKEVRDAMELERHVLAAIKRPCRYC
jgi:hypothetical protein